MSNVDAVEKPSFAKNDPIPENVGFHKHSRIDDRHLWRHKSSPKITPQFPERCFSTASLDLTTMALDGNHMSEGGCYQSRDARDMAVVSLLRTAHLLFSSASIIRDLPRLVQLREKSFPLEEVSPFFRSLDPPFLDAFRIATAFENLFKAELLDFGYVVHKIDRRANAKQFEALAKRQALDPIPLSKVREVERPNWRRRGPFVISSLSHETLTLGCLINERGAYKQSLRLSANLLAALKYVKAQRNTVHFVVNDSGRFNNQIVDWYLTLRATINRRLLPRHTKVTSRYEHLRNNAAWTLSEI